MPLSKRYLDVNAALANFSVERLASVLREYCPEASFALLLGSASNGCVGPHSDLDLAFYLTVPTPRDFHGRVAGLCLEIVGDIRCDVGILNRAEAIYRFEALKGRLLFSRDNEQWLRFNSVTCREYEHQMFRYELQRRYRVKGATA